MPIGYDNWDPFHFTFHKIFYKILFLDCFHFFLLSCDFFSVLLSLFFFAAASHLLSAFYCCIFAGFLLKYLVLIIFFIKNYISYCMNTYHEDRLFHICNINRSWCNYNTEIFWLNLCKTILYLMYLTNCYIIGRSQRLYFQICVLSISSIIMKTN